MTTPESLQLITHDLGDGHAFLAGCLPSDLIWDDTTFETAWTLHPADKHLIMIHGCLVQTPRWQQAYGADYHYTGRDNKALPIPEVLAPLAAWAKAAIHYIGPHHDSTKNMVADQPLASATCWPYGGVTLRPPGRFLANLVRAHLDRKPTDLDLPVSALPPAVVGALASLERYHNRQSRFFDPLRQVLLTSGQLGTLAAVDIPAVTGQSFQEGPVSRRLRSAAQLLALRERGEVSREELLNLDFVGDETADTLLVYFFGQPALIVDEYLKRILYRHHALTSPRASRAAVARLIARRCPLTLDESHRLHARVNEIGVDHCYESEPDCANCPLGHLPRRTAD